MHERRDFISIADPVSNAEHIGPLAKVCVVNVNNPINVQDQIQLPKTDGPVLTKKQSTVSVAVYGKSPSRKHVDWKRPRSAHGARRLEAVIDEPLIGEDVKSINPTRIEGHKQNRSAPEKVQNRKRMYEERC